MRIDSITLYVIIVMELLYKDRSQNNIRILMLRNNTISAYRINTTGYASTYNGPDY